MNIVCMKPNRYNTNKNITRNAQSNKVNNVMRCAEQVFKRRVKIYDTCLLQTGISMIADLSVDVYLYKSYSNYELSHFVEEHMLTWLITSSLYFTYDCWIEFQICDEDMCDIN